MYKMRYFTESELRIEGCTSDLKENMYTLVEMCLDPIRSACGRTKIFSGYRSKAYNKSVGGAKNSQHVEAKAADLRTLDKDIRDTFFWIIENIYFDQLIFEKSDTGFEWIHISYNEGKNRNQVLIANKVNKKWVYKTFQGEVF